MSRRERSIDHSELELLADHLLGKLKPILAEWKDYIKRETGEQISALVSFSQDKFFNSIPLLMERICDGLHDDETSVEKIAKEHGAQRWNHGLDLRELINEWSVLHRVLIDQVNQSQEPLSLTFASVAEAQRQLARHIYTGIRASVDEFYKLQRRKAEGQMNDLEAVVQEQSDQTMQRGESLQEASHDLKGNMTALRMNLYLLKKTELNDRARQLVERLSLSADNLAQMLKNLLTLSRLEAGREKREISEFDAAELLHNLSESMQPMAGAENLELRTSGPDTLKVRGDRQKVQRIAQNLLLNALKYTEEGHVEISWKTESEDYWMFTIRDTGPGMDATNAALLADTSAEPEATGQAPESGENSDTDEVQIQSEGIGLSIVRQLCKLLDAVFEIESEPDAGTTARVIFPADYPED